MLAQSLQRGEEGGKDGLMDEWMDGCMEGWMDGGREAKEGAARDGEKESNIVPRCSVWVP